MKSRKTFAAPTLTEEKSLDVLTLGTGQCSGECREVIEN
jgi:hypothetical protein